MNDGILCVVTVAVILVGEVVRMIHSLCSDDEFDHVGGLALIELVAKGLIGLEGKYVQREIAL